MGSIALWQPHFFVKPILPTNIFCGDLQKTKKLWLKKKFFSMFPLSKKSKAQTVRKRIHLWPVQVSFSILIKWILYEYLKYFYTINYLMTVIAKLVGAIMGLFLIFSFQRAWIIVVGYILYGTVFTIFNCLLSMRNERNFLISREFFTCGNLISSSTVFKADYFL